VKHAVQAGPGGSEMKFATNSDDGVRIAYECIGEGAPLLLFHGSLTSSALWRALRYVDALRAEHQLILVDARGHGHSDKPTTMESYAMERFVGDVIAVLDDCELPKTAYLGYSGLFAGRPWSDRAAGRAGRDSVRHAPPACSREASGRSVRSVETRR
jgi:alpha/beta hydrolase fold